MWRREAILQTGVKNNQEIATSFLPAMASTNVSAKTKVEPELSFLVIPTIGEILLSYKNLGPGL